MILKSPNQVGLLLVLIYWRMEENHLIYPQRQSPRRAEIQSHAKCYINENRNMVRNDDGLCSTMDTYLPGHIERVSIQNKRKRTSPELYFASSSKIVKSKEMDSGVKQEKKGSEERYQHEDETRRTGAKWNLFSQILKKDKDGDTALHLSIVHNDVAKSKALIERMSGKSLDVVNKLQQTPLHLSVLTCQPKLVQFLIFHGASVNVRDRNGQTPLHLASKNADIDCVKAIRDATESSRYSPHTIGQNLDLKLKNFKGEAVFHLAVISGSQESAKTLLDMNANIDIQDGTCGRTALHLAVESHNIGMINFLIENGADVNAITFSGNTPLHLASGLGMDQVVQLLIRKGADINKTNIEGDTPLNSKIVKYAQWKPLTRPHIKPNEQTTKFISSPRTMNRKTNLNLRLTN